MTNLRIANKEDRFDKLYESHHLPTHYPSSLLLIAHQWGSLERHAGASPPHCLERLIAHAVALPSVCTPGVESAQAVDSV